MDNNKYNLKYIHYEDCVSDRQIVVHRKKDYFSMTNFALTVIYSDTHRLIKALKNWYLENQTQSYSTNKNVKCISRWMF